MRKYPSKNNSSLLKEEQQLNFFLKDMLKTKTTELEKTKTELTQTKQLHTETNSKLFDIQQQNQFLKDIRVLLDSKVKVLESTTKIKSKNLKNPSKTYTDKMYFDQQMPLLAINGTIKSLENTLNKNFDKNWIEKFKKLEDNVLLAKLQVEDIVECTEKEALV